MSTQGYLTSDVLAYIFLFVDSLTRKQVRLASRSLRFLADKGAEYAVCRQKENHDRILNLLTQTLLPLPPISLIEIQAKEVSEAQELQQLADVFPSSVTAVNFHYDSLEFSQVSIPTLPDLVHTFICDKSLSHEDAQRLPKQLKKLKLTGRHQYLSSDVISALPQTLNKLHVSGDIHRIDTLPPSLESLTFYPSDSTQMSSLSPHVTTVKLYVCHAAPRDIPPTLPNLKIVFVGVYVFDIAEIPKTVTHLELLDCSPKVAEKLVHLERLRKVTLEGYYARRYVSVMKLPPSTTEVEIQFTTMFTCYTRKFFDVLKFPNVTTLSLVWSDEMAEDNDIVLSPTLRHLVLTVSSGFVTTAMRDTLWRWREMYPHVCIQVRYAKVRGTENEEDVTEE